MGTIFNLPIAEIKYQDILFEDHFDNNIAGWEIIEDEDEKAFISDGSYFMENKFNNHWSFYHKQLKGGFPKSYIISAEIELLQFQSYGQFGIVWGFSKPHINLNKFVISAESPRYTISRFEKNHFRVFHRFSAEKKQSDYNRNKFKFSIMLLDDYYYFFLNNLIYPLYICHKNHLPIEGDRFGFYVEPGIIIRADHIKIQRVITNPRFSENIESSFLSEILNGD